MNLSRSKINALLALALFTFAFLAAEFRFDVNVGLLSGAERVVIAQGFILGASVLGFIGYAPLLGLAQRKGHSLAAVNAAGVPIVIVGLTQIQSPTDPLALEILGCVAFFGLGLLGAAAGAAPSILGYFGAMSSLNTAAPSHNQAAISQIGATANAMTREIFQQASAELGPRIAWNDRPRVSGLAGSSAIYGSSLAGIGAGQHLVPKAVSSIAGGTAGEMMGSAGGTLTRGLHPDAKFNPGKWELTNPVSAAKRQGTVHGVLTRMAVAATTAGLKMAIAQTGLEPGTQASGILDRSLGTLAEARVLTGSYVLEGAEALGFEGADINNDVTSMNPKRTWVASSNDASVRGTSFHLNQYV